MATILANPDGGVTGSLSSGSGRRNLKSLLAFLVKTWHVAIIPTSALGSDKVYAFRLPSEGSAPTMVLVLPADRDWQEISQLLPR